MANTREEAWELLKEYNQEPFHLQHGLTVEGCLRYFAQELGYGDEEDFWGMVGLLHDLDFEKYPEQHCRKEAEILKEKGWDDRLIHAVASHGWPRCSDVKPQEEMEKVLYAVDELSGLIGAAALMRPSKSVQDMEVKSLKKKFKDKHFAAGCSRDVIQQGADMLGWDLNKLFEQSILAMRSCEETVRETMEKEEEKA
ncbi:hydrolase [Acidaminococcus massiliensis]|jgi:predicted hydrolase (HD superfamily)|uniref:hydrolase n=1 Tax=Acidaminococcus massiliensis TaxID=1852375 RepID=UPI0023F01528|nr:hydrolase [Acidaminococcus massiliensis]